MCLFGVVCVCVCGVFVRVECVCGVVFVCGVCRVCLCRVVCLYVCGVVFVCGGYVSGGVCLWWVCVSVCVLYKTKFLSCH